MISLYHHNKCHVATTEPVAKAIFFAKVATNKNKHFIQMSSRYLASYCGHPAT